MRTTTFIASSLALALALGAVGPVTTLAGVSAAADEPGQTSALAVPGDLDPGFGTDGKVTTEFSNLEDVAAGVAIQPDQKIVVGGQAGGPGHERFALARYAAEGTLDDSFGGDGTVRTSFGPGRDWINAVAIQPDGRIIAVGGAFTARGYNVRLALARYNADGSLDTSFGGDGRVLTNITRGYDYVEDVSLQDDGKIVVAGGVNILGRDAKFIVARYGTEGTLDATFGGDGMTITNVDTGFDDAMGVGIQPDGSIVVAGWSEPAGSSNARFALARYTPGGLLDPTFGGDGKVTTNFTNGSDHAWDVALQPDGRIVAVGRAAARGGRFAVARYDTDGALDSGFGGDGKVMTDLNSGSDEATGVVIPAGGAIVVAGWSGPAGSSNSRFAVVRFTADGTVDPVFGGDGTVTTNFTRGSDLAWDVALQADGKIVAVGRAGGGQSQFALARYLG